VLVAAAAGVLLVLELVLVLVLVVPLLVLMGLGLGLGLLVKRASLTRLLLPVPALLLGVLDDLLYTDKPFMD
jgi:hypothetical protein